MKRSKVLVTGGTGYIGAHTVVELHKTGYEVIIADNLSNSSLDVLDGIEKITGERPLFEKVDCTDYSELNTLFLKYEDIKSAIHFAAFKAVGESVAKPLLYYRNNLLSLINLIDIMTSRGESSIVFSSSCTVYGQPDQEHLPVGEDAPLQPAQSPYGKTKQMCEDILKDSALAMADRLKVISLRYFNPVGAHPTAHIGELPLGVPQNLLPFVAQTAAGIRDMLSVWGDDYSTPDGSCIRDYIYVCDLAKAHVAALERVTVKSAAMKDNMEYYNLGTGRGLSVLEVIDIFKRANKIDVPFRIADRRAGDVEQVWADPSKANRELGWSADTPIEEVMQSAWRWEKKIRGLE
jgi:UDP-glucose 4-epimerase